MYKYGSSISQTPFLFSSGIILVDPYTNPNYSVYSIQHILFQTPDYMRFNGTEWLGYIRQVNPIAISTPPPINDIKITSFQPYILFQINAANMIIMPDATFDMQIYVETQDDSIFPVPIRLSWYRDRSAFMADATAILSGNYEQNPYYYFVNETFENSTVPETSVTARFPAFDSRSGDSSSSPKDLIEASPFDSAGAMLVSSRTDPTNMPKYELSITTPPAVIGKKSVIAHQAAKPTQIT
jgi:hypothetical protein